MTRRQYEIAAMRIWVWKLAMFACVDYIAGISDVWLDLMRYKPWRDVLAQRGRARENQG